MPRAREELTVVEWAVLGLVAEEPTHGFAIETYTGGIVVKGNACKKS